MSIQHFRFNPKELMALGILLSIFLAAPICHAGDAVKLVPAQDQDMPGGSHISKERLKKIDKKVKAQKAKLKEKAAQQQQEKTPKNETTKTKAPD